MLEIKDMTEEERRKYINYNVNLVNKYKMLIIIVRFTIKEHGLQVFLGQEDTEIHKENMMLKIPIDERRDIYRFMERNANYTEAQLAKELFREREYYPR